MLGGLLGGCGLPDLYPDTHHHGRRYYPPYDDPVREVLERESPPGPAQANPSHPSVSADVAKGIEDLKRKQAEAMKAEAESLQLIEDLRRTAARLQDDVGRYESLAKGSVGFDESQARLYLQRRQAAAEQAAGLETRIKEMERDVDRLQALKVELDAKILDLTAVGQRDRLARLEGEIKGLQP